MAESSWNSFNSKLMLVAFIMVVTGSEAIADPVQNKNCSGAPFLSYHVHALFWGSNETSVKAATDLYNDFKEAFKTDGAADDCTFPAGDPQPKRTTMCAYDLATEPEGPFLTGQWSFFVPSALMQQAAAWTMSRRGNLDVMVHPNTGCEVEDHITWPLWGGMIWEIDASIFTCEFPGCVPKDGVNP